MLYIIFHPNLKSSHVNQGLAQEAANNKIAIKDIYSLYPNFIIDSKLEQEELLKSDKVIIQFPIRWYSAPAMYHQYLEQVLLYGFAYGSDFKLEGKKVYLVISTGGTKEAYQAQNDDLGEFGKYIRGIKDSFTYCKMNVRKTFVLFDAMHASESTIKEFAQSSIAQILAD
jgi:putative NADPH-quinone reductase